MLTLPHSVKIYAALDPVDMRKSHHGLAAIVREKLELDPLSGHLVLFTNKRRNLLKVLFFDRTGLALLYKRLEQGTFQLPVVENDDAQVEIDPGQLAMILEGIDLRSAVRRKRYKRHNNPPSES